MKEINKCLEDEYIIEISEKMRQDYDYMSKDFKYMCLKLKPICKNVHYEEGINYCSYSKQDTNPSGQL